MWRALALLMFAQAIATDVQAQATASREICGVSYKDARELARYFDGNPKLERRETEPPYQVFADGPGRLWTLTTEGHKAHFTAACREIVEENGVLRLQSKIACFSSQEYCDWMAGEFRFLATR